MSDKNPFEIINGQVILHDSFQGVDRTVLNNEQVAAIELLIQKYICKGHSQNQLNQYTSSLNYMYYLHIQQAY